MNDLVPVFMLCTLRGGSFIIVTGSTLVDGLSYIADGSTLVVDCVCCCIVVAFGFGKACL